MSDSKSDKPKCIPFRMKLPGVSPNASNLWTPYQSEVKRPLFRPLRNEELNLMSVSQKKVVRKKLGFERPTSDNKPAVKSAKPKLSFVPNQRKTASFTRTSQVMPPRKSKYISDLSGISEGIAELDITRTSFGADAHKSKEHSSVNKFAMRKSSAPCTITKKDVSTQYEISENITRVDTSTQTDLSETTHCNRTVPPVVKSKEAECSVVENFEDHIQSFMVHKTAASDTVLQELNVCENKEVQNSKTARDNTSGIKKCDEENQNLSFLLWEAFVADCNSPEPKGIQETFNEMKCLVTELNEKFDVMAEQIKRIENIEKNKENINIASSQPDVCKTPKTDSKNDLRRRILMLNHVNPTPHTQLKSAKKWGNSLNMYNNMKHEILSLQTPVVDKSQRRIIFSKKKNPDTSYNLLNQCKFLIKTPSDEE